MGVLLADQVAADPDGVAVVDDRGTTTWGRLDERVTRLVHALRDRGLGSGDRVVTLLGNQAEAVEAALACAQGGWIQVPLNWHGVADEVAYVLADAEANALVVDGRWVPVAEAALAQAPVPSLRCRLVAHGDAEGFEAYDDVLAASRAGEIADAERGGPMFYTSGTTGHPKGVRSALAAVGGPPEVLTLIAHSMRPVLDLPADGGGVQLVCGPIYHSAQWVFGHFALLCGASVVLQHRFDADELLTLIDRHGVTNVHLVPTQMARMLALPDERRAAFSGGSLHSVIHGAAPCPPELKRRMIDWLGPVVSEYYGGTEGGFIAKIDADEWLVRPGSVGRPLPIMEVTVLREDGRPAAVDEPGDIWFRNRMGTDFEYHKAPEKTAAAHREAGFATLGDIGYLDDDGYLYLSDRRIDMVVSGGVNIYPAEIEGVLAGHPAVADAAVFGVPHPEMGEAVHAALAIAPGATWGPELEAEVVAHCRAHLAGYKCPRSFEVHDELPRSAAGKLTKRALRDPWWADRDTAI